MHLLNKNNKLSNLNGSDDSVHGFTIIEIMIVLAVAGIILLIVFLAVPALERNSRNNSRKHDASLLVDAIEECLVNNGNQDAACQSTSALSLQPSEFSAYTGFHYGQSPGGQQLPPTINEPNWLFGLTCPKTPGAFFPTNPDGSFTGYAHSFVVTYVIENGDGSNNYQCIDGGF